MNTRDVDGFDDRANRRYPREDAIWRTRKCKTCGHRFETVEVKVRVADLASRLTWAEAMLQSVKDEVVHAN
jgi:transcriptional regulator NrdR family protein